MSKLRHVGILVHDLKLSTLLYKDVFGFEVINEGKVQGKYAEELFNATNFELSYIKLKSKGCNVRLELWKIKNFLPNDAKGFSHIALTVPDIDRVYFQLKERKIKFFSPPIKSPDSAVRLFFCKDYDGNLLEIVEDKNIKF